MPGLRKLAEQELFAFIEELLPGSGNKEIYQARLAKMSDEEFEQLIVRIEQGEPVLDLVVPNLMEAKLDQQRIYDVADKLGHDFFENIWIPPEGDVPGYWTPIKYPTIISPVGRQAQLLSKKIRLPDNNSVVDDLTGQPTGASKSSRISYPELQTLSAMGFDDAIRELVSVRGGDERAFAAYRASFERTGGVSLRAIEPFSSGVKSVTAFNNYLYGMQLNSNL